MIHSPRNQESAGGSVRNPFDNIYQTCYDIYHMTQVIQTFTLGRSVVATMPKSLGIKSGTKFHVQRLRDSIVFRPAKAKNISAIIDKIKGGLNLKKTFGKPLSPEDINKIIDDQYKNVLPRR